MVRPAIMANYVPAAVQNQKAVTAHFPSKKLLHFDFQDQSHRTTQIAGNYSPPFQFPNYSI